MPQSLFDEKGKIRVERERFFSEFATFAEPEPGEKIFGKIDPTELSTNAGIDRFVTMAKHRQPDLLAEFADRYFGKTLDKQSTDAPT